MMNVNNSQVQKRFNSGMAAVFTIFATLIAFAVWQINRNVPSPSPVPSVYSSEVDQIEGEVEKLKWRIESATRAGEAAAKRGDTAQADKWAEHIGELESQLVNAERRLNDARKKQSDKANDKTKD